MKKILEFCGTPELLIALLYSDDVCQTIKSEVMASGKVSMFVFSEDEPCCAPDSDEIKPQVNLGEPVQIEDDGKRLCTHSEGTTHCAWCGYKAQPEQIVDDLRFCDVMERDQLNVQFDGADEMMGQGVVKMRLRETLSHDWMEGDDAEVVGT